MTRRLLLLLSICMGLLLSLMSYALWAGADRIEVVHHDLRTTRHGQAWRLVQISDLHLRGFAEREIALAQTVVALSPDVIVLSGDAIDRADAVPWLRSFVNALGRTPVLLVPGNWEHWSEVDFTSLKTIGATLLLNERWALARGDRQLEVIGLDDYTAGHPDIRLLSGGGAEADSVSAVLVQHSPGFFDHEDVRRQLAGRRLTLCLSGHTHGGQIAIAGWAPWTPPGSGRFTAGFYDVPGCRLYVSRGVGTSVIPLRLGARSEVAVFEF
jgi:predicted MPP superfamily phosphohydrolase